MHCFFKSFLSFKPTVALSLLAFAGCQSHVKEPQKTATSDRPLITFQKPAKSAAKLTKNQSASKKPTSSGQSTAPLTAWQAIVNDPGFEMPSNARIEAQKAWYLKHPAFLSKVLGHSEPFLGYVIAEIDKRNLPRALALLPIVESRYDPQAISKAGAMGTWQFMPVTAAHFGLKMNWWFDGRQDVITSTHAALTYLDQLNQRFDGDWLLALASYNVGAGNVNKAIRNHGLRDNSPDYWSLQLPEETLNYVPRLIALLEIISDASKYGVVLPNIDAGPKVTAISTKTQIEMSQLAKLAGLTEAEFRNLNPGHKRWASDPAGPFDILVPTHKVESIISGLETLPPQQLSWKKHIVKPGDTLSQIANRYNVPTSEFKKMNQLSTSFIKVGQSLLVPQDRPIEYAASTEPVILKTSLLPSKARVSTASSSRSKQPINRHTIKHVVKAGDTLWSISLKHKTPVSALIAENELSTHSPIKVGQVLLVSLKSAELSTVREDHASAQTTSPSGTTSQLKSITPIQVNTTDPNPLQVSYEVKPGDSLYGIARRFKVSVQEIASWNTLDQQHHIKPGQELQLYLSEES